MSAEAAQSIAARLPRQCDRNRTDSNTTPWLPAGSLGKPCFEDSTSGHVPRMSTDLYVATVTATVGAVTSSDGFLSLDVHEPAELGGPGGSTNPEQLMAAALSSCLVESLRIAVGTAGGSLDHLAVEASVTLTSSDGPGYGATSSLRVSLPGVDNPQDVLTQAVSICPFLSDNDGITVSLV